MSIKLKLSGMKYKNKIKNYIYQKEFVYKRNNFINKK